MTRVSYYFIAKRSLEATLVSLINIQENMALPLLFFERSLSVYKHTRKHNSSMCCCDELKIRDLLHDCGEYFLYIQMYDTQRLRSWS